MYPDVPDIAAMGFAARGDVKWSQADIDVLKSGVLSISADPHYGALRNKYYWISHYIMDGKFAKDDVRRQVLKMVRDPKRYA